MRGDHRSSHDAWAIERLRNGWHPRAVATACGISVRTAYRWRRTTETVTVTIGGWSAEFVTRDGSHPVRVSDWQPVR